MYANEAFAGVYAASRAGWITPLNDPTTMAATIAGITDEDIDYHSDLALAFASQHTMETEFAKRMEHVLRLSSSVR